MRNYKVNGKNYDLLLDCYDGAMIPYPVGTLDFINSCSDFCTLSGNQGEETGIYYYHPDHLGSTGMVTDINDNIVQGFLYAPFGEIVNEYNPGWSSDRVPNYAFNAKELDEENGMYYYSARYYAPPTFISRDPMFEKYPSISPYTYCANNPMKFVDPTGKYFDEENEGHAQNFEKATREKLSDVEKQMSLIEDKESEQYKNLQTQQTEYNNALGEVQALRNDDKNEYRFNFVHNDEAYNLQFGSNSDGQLTYGGKSANGGSIVNINIRGFESLTLSKQSHELKHAFQFYQGKLGFYVKNGIYIGSNMNQEWEKAAYFRGDIFSGNIKQGTNFSNYSNSAYSDLYDNGEYSIQVYNKVAIGRGAEFITNK